MWRLLASGEAVDSSSQTPAGPCAPGWALPNYVAVRPGRRAGRVGLVRHTVSGMHRNRQHSEPMMLYMLLTSATSAKSPVSRSEVNPTGFETSHNSKIVVASCLEIANELTGHIPRAVVVRLA